MPGATPRAASARGLDDSITTSATSSRDTSAARPALALKSTERLRCPACSQSKNSRLPERAPSGRAGDSTLMTFAPARPSRRAQSGPAHIDERSATTAPASRAPASGSAMRVARHGGQPARRGQRAPARPRRAGLPLRAGGVGRRRDGEAVAPPPRNPRRARPWPPP